MLLVVRLVELVTPGCPKFVVRKMRVLGKDRPAPIRGMGRLERRLRGYPGGCVAYPALLLHRN